MFESTAKFDPSLTDIIFIAFKGCLRVLLNLILLLLVTMEKVDKIGLRVLLNLILLLQYYLDLQGLSV